MKKLYILIGRIIFWLSWPIQRVVLSFSTRTRVLVITQDNKVLLLRGWIGSGCWGLPGGALHRNEVPSHGASRELYEETGINISPDKLMKIGVAKHRQHGLRYKYYQFAVAIKTPKSVKTNKYEIADYCWQPISKLDELSLCEEVHSCIDNWNT